jgi:hypothetical protein
MFASNHHQIFRPSINNENSAILPAKSNGDGSGTVSKTPAASGKQRRALGDISNRKGGGLGGNNNGSNKGAVLPKKSQTPGVRLQQTRAPFSSTNGKSKTPGLSSKKSEIAVLPRHGKTASSSSAVNILPMHNKSVARNKMEAENKAKVTFEEPVDDIEKPAGRLWVDQLDYDDDTSLSLPGAATLREDWAAADLARHKRRLEQMDETDQRADAALDELVAKQLQEDGTYSVG